mmetsp:Transcript_115115/g.326114  ORF Transcript_115115/g.326114 Transcript_115115/m.326114 type:complete len:238 (+) Transcript_115115:963-1676(+)
MPPPPQETEHSPQSCHAPHLPSTQGLFESGSHERRHAMEGTTSSIARGWQSCPLPLGRTTISRVRLRNPTPQYSAFSHLLQSNHAPHSQSRSSLQASPPAPTQPRTSERPMLQPYPSGLAAWVMRRLRVCWPCPHCSLQPDHGDQSDTAQSSSRLHGSSLHGSDSLRSPLQGAPPRGSTSRVRKRCPPPQLTPQSPQGAQSEKMHEADPSLGQTPVSFTAPAQGRPRPWAGPMVRTR